MNGIDVYTLNRINYIALNPSIFGGCQITSFRKDAFEGLIFYQETFKIWNS